MTEGLQMLNVQEEDHVYRLSLITPNHCCLSGTSVFLISCVASHSCMSTVIDT